MLKELPEGGQLSGEAAFFLKGSLGLPLEVTRDVAQERGYTVDQAGFETAQKRHEIDSGAGHAMGKIEQGAGYNAILDQLKSSGKLPASGLQYDPYSSMERKTHLLALIRDEKPVARIAVVARL